MACRPTGPRNCVGLRAGIPSSRGDCPTGTLAASPSSVGLRGTVRAPQTRRKAARRMTELPDLGGRCACFDAETFRAGARAPPSMAAANRVLSGRTVGRVPARRRRGDRHGRDPCGARGPRRQPSAHHQRVSAVQGRRPVGVSISQDPAREPRGRAAGWRPASRQPLDRRRCDGRSGRRLTHQADAQGAQLCTRIELDPKTCTRVYRLPSSPERYDLDIDGSTQRANTFVMR